MQTEFINSLCESLGLSKRLMKVTIEHDFTDSHGLTKITSVEAAPRGAINLPITKQFVLREINQKSNQARSEFAAFVDIDSRTLQYWVANQFGVLAGGAILRKDLTDRMLKSEIRGLADSLDNSFPNILIGVDAGWGKVTQVVTTLRDKRCVPTFNRLRKSRSMEPSYTVSGNIDQRLIVTVYCNEVRIPDKVAGPGIAVAIADFIHANQVDR